MISEDIMTRNPVTVTEDTTIGEAMGVLYEENVRHLPVVRGDDVVGIVSDRDFSGIGASLLTGNRGYEDFKARLNQPVSSLMTGGVVTVDRDSDAAEIIDLMLDEKLSAIPVVETATQTLVGIVSYVDILRAARSLFDAT